MCKECNVAESIRTKEDECASWMVFTVTVAPSSRRKIVDWRKDSNEPRARIKTVDSKSMMDAKAWYGEIDAEVD
eukprot:13548654-Ditylum_brightwellii.AAC.1